MPPPAVPKQAPVANAQDKFSFEKAEQGGITLLKLHGTLDHAFEGKKIAESAKGRKLVVDMREVRRYASWGMSEWMDFLRINSDRDLYLVECSTYSVGQINLVTGLLGHGKLVSFYAPYRCASCGEESETLFIVPVDRAVIRDLASSIQDCTTCGGRARLEEYPASFFETIAGRQPFDIDDEVLAYFRTKLNYPLTPDLTRFRAYRRVDKAYTYIRMSGSMATLPSDFMRIASQGTTVIDLERVVFDPVSVTGWRTYVTGVLPKLKSLQLLNCPPGFLENAVNPQDLRDKLKVRTFALSYNCQRCNTTTAHMVDVAENLEQLVRGIVPPAQCPGCKSSIEAALTPGEAALVRSLPAREQDPALDRFLAKARTESVEKLEDCLIARAQELPKAPAGPRRAIYLAVALTMMLIVGLAVVAFFLWRERTETVPVAANPQPAVTPPIRPVLDRPDWIMSDVPSSAYCHDMINRLMCVGVSPFSPTRDVGVTQANDAALDELVSSVGLKITDPLFRNTIISAYSDARSKGLSALQAADLDRSNKAYAAAEDVVGKARKRVTEILQASGGAAVPAQRSDWYWEEYAAKGGGTEFLVFVRYDVTLDAVRTLVEKYSATTPILGSQAMTAFPALAWRYPDFAGGAMLTKVGNPLTEAGIAPKDVISAVEGQGVGDVGALERRLDEWKHATGDLKLTVKTGAAPARELSVKRPHGM